MKKIIPFICAALLICTIVTLAALAWQTQALDTKGLYIAELTSPPDAVRLERAALWYPNVAVELSDSAAVMRVEGENEIAAYRCAEGVLGILLVNEDDYTLYAVSAIPQSIMACLRLLILCVVICVAIILTAWLTRYTHRYITCLRELSGKHYPIELLREHWKWLLSRAALPVALIAVLVVLLNFAVFEPPFAVQPAGLADKLWSGLTGAGLLPPSGVAFGDFAEIAAQLAVFNALANIALIVGILSALILTWACVLTCIVSKYQHDKFVSEET